MKIGDKIPDFLGIDQNGNDVFFQNKNLIIYFYPKDNTPGCTSQACSIRDEYNDLLKSNYDIIGISVDSKESHIKFINKYNLPFTLISDYDKQLVNKFDVWKEKQMMGKKYMGIIRTTFFVDSKGIIFDIIKGSDINTKNHSSQILEIIAKNK